jgi:hypothetical protein
MKDRRGVLCIRFFIRSLDRSPTRCFYSYNRIIRTGKPDGALIALQAAIVTDFQPERTVAGRRLAGQDTLPATVAQFFIHFILVIIIHGIIRIHISYNTPQEGVLGADLACWYAALIRKAAYIHVSRAKHSIAALFEIINRFNGGMAQNAGCTAKVAGCALERIDLVDGIAGCSVGQHSRCTADTGDADNADGFVDKFAAGRFLTHVCTNSQGMFL